MTEDEFLEENLIQSLGVHPRTRQPGAQVSSPIPITAGF
jgi:hypothetical protein